MKRVEFRRLATLYFAVRQVGHKRGNTRNRSFQLAMQQCSEKSWRKLPVARIIGPLHRQHEDLGYPRSANLRPLELIHKKEKYLLVNFDICLSNVEEK